MPTESDIQIAVMKSQIEGLREQHKSHRDEITGSITKLSDKVEELMQFMDRYRGGAAAIIIVASGFGGIIVAIAEHVLTKYL